MIETFLLEQNLAKRTKASISSDFRVRRHETTSRPADLSDWAEKHKEFLAPIRIEKGPLMFGTGLVRTFPQGLFSPYCSSSSPFSFARFDFPLPA